VVSPYSDLDFVGDDPVREVLELDVCVVFGRDDLGHAGGFPYGPTALGALSPIPDIGQVVAHVPADVPEVDLISRLQLVGVEGSVSGCDSHAPSLCVMSVSIHTIRASAPRPKVRTNPLSSSHSLML